MDFPIISVNVIYPGADPESIEQRVLKPLEEAVNGIAGLKTINSIAFPGIAQMVLQFKLEVDADTASQDVRDKIFAKLYKLPAEIETPIIQKFDISGAPILALSLSSPTKSLGELSQLVKDTVQPQLQRVTGVSQVSASGNREREIQIRLDRSQLASFGLQPSEIIQSVQQQNLDIPSGKVEEGAQYRPIRLAGIKENIQQIANLPILTSTGYGRLKIQDVAEVLDTVQDEENAAFIGKTPTILLSVFKQSGANTTTVSDETQAVVQQLMKTLPKDVHLQIVTDNSIFIRGSIDAIKLDLLLGAFLAVFVVLLFLRDRRATLISAIALPTAVIATFGFLQYMGFTLNMMTTLGLSLSIGILIDDAIVVIENVYRHLEMKKNPKVAAYDATKEIGLAVFATTLTICAVFVPVAFMEGIIGRFFYQFGLTVTFAVLVSLWVAFTVTPMLSSRLLLEGEHAHPSTPPETRFGRLASSLSKRIESILNTIDQTYHSMLEWALVHRFLTLGIGFGIFILSIILLSFVPVSFFAKEDRGQVTISYTMPENTRLETAKQRSLEIVDFIQQYAGIERIITKVGAGSDKRPNFVTLDVDLIPKEDRAFSQDDFLDRLRHDVSPLFTKDGSELVVSRRGGPGGGGGHTEQIQLIFKSNDYNQLVRFTDQVAQFVKTKISNTTDVSTTKPKKRKEYVLHVDEARAMDLGLTSAQIALATRSLFEGEKVGEVRNLQGTFDVRVRIADKDKHNLGDISGVLVTSRTGQKINLGTVARIEESLAPSEINRTDGQKQIMVLSNFTGKDLQGVIRQVEEYVKKHAPSDVTMSLAGEADIMKDSIASMITALMLAIILIYMILCAQYERYLAPFVIMLALPLSLSGAFGALLLTGQVMSVYTMIGLILLMGIVTKNGILLIDFTLQRIAEGKNINEALLEAGVIRLRPILMTTLAAGFGMLPVAIGHGEGGEAKSPMGIAVIGGLLASTLLTLVIVPCFFSVMEEWRSHISIQKVRFQIVHLANNIAYRIKKRSIR